MLRYPFHIRETHFFALKTPDRAGFLGQVLWRMGEKQCQQKLKWDDKGIGTA